MTTNDKQVIQLLKRRIFPKYNRCYKPKCSNKLTNKSAEVAHHFLQSITALDHIAVLEPKDSDDYIFNKSTFDALTFTPFSYLCDSCYSEFHNYAQPLDQLDQYKTQLWWTYSEFMKLCFDMYYDIEWFKMILETPEISSRTKVAYRNRYYLANIKHSTCQFIKQKVKSDFDNNTTHFNFTYLELPHISVLAKGAFLIPIPVIFTGDFMEEINKQKRIQPLQSFNIILTLPKTNAWCVMLGTDSIERLIGKLNVNLVNHTEQQSIKYINDLLIKYVDQWVISEDVYELWEHEAITNEIINQKIKYAPDYMKLRDVDYNVFYDKW